MTKDHYQTIYDNHALRYDDFIQHHDVEGNLLTAIKAITDLSGKKVVEFGAGTGRLTALLAPFVQSIQAFDASEAMLDIAQQRLGRVSNVTFAAADNTSVPVKDNSADLTIEGWSIAHSRFWASDWRATVSAMLDEMMRITRPGGIMIVLETMGTGRETAQPPNEELATLYEWWEQKYPFTFQTIRMDYVFETVEEAAGQMGFFFGKDMGELIRQKNWKRVPEYAGIWWSVC